MIHFEIIVYVLKMFPAYYKPDILIFNGFQNDTKSTIDYNDLCCVYFTSTLVL